MITEKRLNDLGKEPFLELVRLIKAFLHNKEYHIQQTQNQEIIEMDFGGIAVHDDDIPGSFQTFHNVTGSNTLRIPSTLVFEINGLKLEKSIEQLVKDGVLETFIEQYTIYDKAVYVSFTYEQNSQDLGGGNNAPGPGSHNNKYWDLSVECRMNAVEVDKYLADTLKIANSHTTSTGKTKHLAAISEKELTDVGRNQYLAFLKLLKTFMLTKSYGNGRAGQVNITGSLVNKACGTKFKEILELLVNDGVLEKFIKGDGKAWLPEYVAYDGVMNYRYGLDSDKPEEDRGAKDEYYDYYFECLMGPEELDQYIEEIRTLGKKWDENHANEETPRLIQEMSEHRISIPEQEVAEVGKDPLLELLRVIKSYMPTKRLGKDGRLSIPNRDITAISGLNLEESINLLIKYFVLDKFVVSYDWFEPNRVKSVSFDYEENGEGQAFDNQEDARKGHYHDLIVQTTVTIAQISQCIASIISSGDESTPMQVVAQDASRNTEKLGRLIHKDAHGDFFYDGKRIEMSQGTIYYKVFDVLYEQADQRGFLSYEKIEKFLVNSGMEGIENVMGRNKRITNAMGMTGLFNSAKVGGDRLKNETLDGRKLVEPVVGKGWKLNNPKI